MKLSEEQYQQLVRAFQIAVGELRFTAMTKQQGGLALLSYLAACEQAPGVVSSVIDYVGRCYREVYKDQEHLMLCQLAPSVAGVIAMDDADEDMSRRVARSVQWINGIWAADQDQTFAVWKVIESLGDDIVHDLAQALTFCEGLIYDLQEDTGRPVFSTIKQED